MIQILLLWVKLVPSFLLQLGLNANQQISGAKYLHCEGECQEVGGKLHLFRVDLQHV